MKLKKFLRILFLIIFLFSVKFNSLHAQVFPDSSDTSTSTDPNPVTIHLIIENNSGHIYDNSNLNVNACDSDNPSSGNLTVTAYCAVLQSNLPSDWNRAWAPGIFLNSINGISGFTTQDSNGTDVYHYWSWVLQRDHSISDALGLNEYQLQTGDIITLTFIDPVNPPPPPPESHIGGGNYVAPKITFDLQKATNFLISKQKTNGSFEVDLYTDWTAIALASNQNTPKTNLDQLIKYFSTETFSSTLLTDYERHAIALMSLNLNPYNLNGENFIKKIIDNFDGTQFGDKEKDNDDIFALIVLQNAGYTENDKIISNTINFILSKQQKDGSWDENTDLTGAGIEALSTFQNDENVKKALENAENYLKKNQKTDGSWGNVSSTAWAEEGLKSLDEKVSDATLEYLGENQDTDGGIKDTDTNNKLWETAYVVTSLSTKTWTEIMQKFEAPIENSSKNILTPELKKITLPAKKSIAEDKILLPKIEATSQDQTQNLPVEKPSFWRRILNFFLSFN